MVKAIFRLLVLVFVMTIFFVGTAPAADKWEQLSVKAALQSDLAKEKLDPGLSFYMKGQKHRKARSTSGEYTSNKRSRKFRRSTEDACQQAFISALLSFQQRANKEDRNAVIDLYSITKDKKFVSTEKYSCLVGGMAANVALRGKVANIGK